jgi:Dockerin type I domain
LDLDEERTMLNSRVARAAMLLALWPGVLPAAAVPVGTELQLNAYTAGAQRNAVVACSTTNDFTVVWDGAATSDGSVSTVFAQRSNAAAQPLGVLFEATSQACSAQACDPSPAFDPSVCRADNGDFVVVWERPYGADGDGSAVAARRFDSTGTARGSEFQVNSYTRGYQYAPAIACKPSGDFIVVWQQEEGGQTGIFGRRFTSIGVTVGPEFHVDSRAAGYASSPRLALAEAGDFVVTWTGGGYFSSPDGSGLAVLARHFNSGGSPQGSEFVVNAFTLGYQQLPSIAHLTGAFVVAWESGDYYDTQDGGYAGIFARRLDDAAALVGSEFQVNGHTLEYQQRPTVAAAGDAFVIAWQSGDYYGSQDGSYAGIFARRFTSAGAPQSAEFQVNGYTPGDQAYPSACLDDLGNFLVAWDSLDQDGSDTGLFARRYAVTDLSGHVRYYAGNRPVPGAQIDLVGEPVPDATTNGAGGFSFATVGNEPRTLRPRRMGGMDQGVSSLDAAFVSQAKVGLRTFDAFQNLACDVTGNGTISSLDAAIIKQLKVGIIDRFPVAEQCGSDWAFAPRPAAGENQNALDPQIGTGFCQPGAIGFTPLVPPQSDQDFIGVLFGDCTGNWQP